MTREKSFYELMDTLYESSRLINNYESIPRHYGTNDKLYMVEAHMLDLIGLNKDITVSEIADRTNRTLSAISQTVNKLINKKLVKRYRNPNNHKEYLLKLTEKGKIIFDYHSDLDKVEYEKHLKNLHHFSEQDFKNFIEISKTINKRIKNVIEEKEVLKL